MENYEPEIVAFCCHYCAYTAADMAGSKRISYPANVKIIRVPCTGKVDAIHIMKALEKGADGVYVAGCLEGDCHFKTGNARARLRVARVQKILEDLGWEKERVAMINMSAGMGERFAKTAFEFTEKIKSLGPNPISQGKIEVQAVS
ncbi:MAG: hydrogenase iron-sulfur subunit [Desulfobacteraceae bacterium]|nr:hydrogenase iron-sulfur subunit [Desulfobacteraceae bacterium]